MVTSPKTSTGGPDGSGWVSPAEPVTPFPTFPVDGGAPTFPVAPTSPIPPPTTTPVEPYTPPVIIDGTIPGTTTPGTTTTPPVGAPTDPVEKTLLDAFMSTFGINRSTGSGGSASGAPTVVYDTGSSASSGSSGSVTKIIVFGALGVGGYFLYKKFHKAA